MRPVSDKSPPPMMRIERLPARLGDYVLLEEIGGGGVGRVFKAHHRHLERIDAVKILNPIAESSPEKVARFRRELKAHAKLRHPNIVTTYGGGEIEGLLYLAMEFINGPTLERLVMQEEGPLGWKRAIDYLLQAGRGIEHAHACGVLHRDIKPSNIMLAENTSIKVLDMGLARIARSANPAPILPPLADGDDSSNLPVDPPLLTHTYTVMGTAAYMAPEQARRLKAADERADIYSLGCTLFFLLSGRPPFKGESFIESVVSHLEQPIPELDEVCQGAPKGLKAIITRMLAKLPEDRYQKVSEVLYDLERLQQGQLLEALASSVSPATPQKEAPAQEPRVSPSGELIPFTESLESAGFFTSEEIEHFLASFEPHQRPSNRRQMTDELAQAEWITNYQAAALNVSDPEDLVYGDYYILDKIDVGKHAVLYLAEHGPTGEAVALKTLAPDSLQTIEEMNAFNQMIRQHSSLKHPYLCEVYDGGIKGATPYLAMEWIDSLSLASRVKRQGPIEYEIALRYIRQAAEALGYALNKGMTHLNIHPGQMLVDSRGNIKLTDLGLTQFYREMPHAPETSAMTEATTDTEVDEDVLGVEDLLGDELQTDPSATRLLTPEFLAPEGKDQENLDFRTDIYCLGSTFFFLVSGATLYRGGSTEELLDAHRYEPIPAMRDFVSGGSETMEQVFRGMVAKRPQDRYRNYADLVSDLELLSEELAALSAALSRVNPHGDKSRDASRSHNSGGRNKSRSRQSTLNGPGLNIAGKEQELDPWLARELPQYSVLYAIGGGAFIALALYLLTPLLWYQSLTWVLIYSGLAALGLTYGRSETPVWVGGLFGAFLGFTAGALLWESSLSSSDPYNWLGQKALASLLGFPIPLLAVILAVGAFMGGFLGTMSGISLAPHLRKWAKKTSNPKQTKRKPSKSLK
ncbi:Hypothetical protein PBC10988_26100 [Planctomycetales bacterium 10988]|nr:Hypothetical protein PBC10988_26100 [Planctomycetales bacterium 10988]